MTERTMPHGADRVIGSDRDPDGILRSLSGGLSVIVSGSLGAGKSHLLRMIARELHRTGYDPVVLRPSAVLSTVPFGVLEDHPDPRSAVLRDDDGAAGARPLVVVVDDAQWLDAESASVLSRAIHRRRAVALLAVAAPRARAAPTSGSADAASGFIDLWLHGGAERIDLRELVASDAEQLLDLFPGTERLDSVARATVISLADGSRILLRELAAHASGAIAAGGEPVTAFSDIQRHSRLGDAIFAHVAEIGEQDRSAMAVLGRLPGIDHADAARLLPPALLDGLIAARLVHDDGSARHRLFPVSTLAAEAAHQIPVDELEDLLGRAASRMLAANGAWWSSPLAVMLAERWHSGTHLAPFPEDATAEMRVRAALDAARQANDTGRPALAAAYAASAQDIAAEPCELTLERAYAESILSGLDGPLSTVDPEELDPSALTRFLQLRAHVRGGADLRDRLAFMRETTTDELLRARIELAIAESSALELEWPRAIESARAASESGDVPSQVRAALLCALGRVNDGSWAGAGRHLARARELCVMPGTRPSVSTVDRLLVLCVDVLAAQWAGVEAPGADERRRELALLAARERSAIGLVLSGFAAALVHARAGDAESANAEIRAAARRSLHLPLGPGVSIVQMAIARALSILGRAPEARALLRDATATSGAPLLLEHAEWLTQSCILAAEGRTLEALDSAEEASELSDVPGSRILHLRDLYQLAALGAADDVLLHKMRSIAESSDIGAAHGLAQRATAMLRGQKTVSQRTPVERLRQGAPWSNAMSVSDAPPALGTPQPADLAGTAPPLLRASMAFGLTRREQEIADLVAEGLSNREIAEQLFLSVRTVESHVYQARAKVGAGSRRELGRLAGARIRPRDGASG